MADVVSGIGNVVSKATPTSLDTHKKDNKNKDGNGTGDDDKTTPSKQPSRVKTYELEDEHTSAFLCRVVSLTLLSIFPALAFGVIFTYIGWGATIHKFLVKQITMK